MTFQKTDPTAPLASHPCLYPQEAASAGMRVPEAGSEAGAGPRGELPDSGGAPCWGRWSMP